MSDETSAAISAVRRDWVSEHREMYLRSGGAEGHIMDITAVGGRAFATHCMIKYTGRKTGRIFITPLCYADIGGEVVICASKGGADENPAWYLNIVDAPEIEFQIATQAFRASWREPVGAERDKVWAFLIDCHPFYASYQASTDRVLPLVMMQPIAPIAVFRETDATASGRTDRSPRSLERLSTQDFRHDHPYPYPRYLRHRSVSRQAGRFVALAGADRQQRYPPLGACHALCEPAAL